MQKIALFGGAFDPIHEGHLHIAKLALERLKIDKIYFIPLKQAVHKDQPQFSEEERIKKITDLIKNEPKFEISTVEIEKERPSYTIDTVRDFLASPEAFGHILSKTGEDPSQIVSSQNILTANKTDLDLYYIIGTDAFEDIFSWKKPHELLELLKFIVVERPGYKFSKIEEIFNKKENRKYLDRIFFIEDEGIDISSTKIREQINDNIN